MDIIAKVAKHRQSTKTIEQYIILLKYLAEIKKWLKLTSCLFLDLIHEHFGEYIRIWVTGNALIGLRFGFGK